MTQNIVTLDYALAMADEVGAQGGLTAAQLDAEAPAFERAARRVLEEAQAGILGFFGLPADTATADAIDRYVTDLPEQITDVLILGIGGSSLGTRAVQHALGGPPELGPLPKGRRLHLPDNADPWMLSALLDHLAPENTLVVVISKSGGTVETAAQMLVVRDWLKAGLGDAASKHQVFVTDPEKGSLRQLANEEKIQTFAIPGNVGGRFSVLTAVGLLPARLAGYDVKGLLAGAAHMAERCRSPKLRENPAGLVAALHVLHARLLGHKIHVLMPYADALRPFAAWYVQLWAESLGKRVDRAGRIVETGFTPVPAVGATDQHAQNQLFIEGPRDKVLTFIRVKETKKDLTMSASGKDYGYLNGHTLFGLLDAELRGTRQALADDGRPSITLEIDRVDAPNLGALFFLYEAATAFAGELMGIDAFDQPGVELGKRLAFGLLGREGFEAERTRIESAEKGRPSQYRA